MRIEMGADFCYDIGSQEVLSMNDVKRNKVITIATEGLRTVSLLCLTGPVMQTFLASLGFSSSFIYINNTLMQITTVLTILFCSQWADKGNIVKRTAICEIPHAILYLCYIPLCIWKSASLTSFLILTGIALMQTLCTALHTICYYKLPYYLYNSEDYGKVLAASGLFASVISLLCGAMVTWLAAFMDYAKLMLLSCGISALLMGLCVILHLKQKAVIENTQDVSESEQLTSIFALLKYPIFYKMIPANIFRGFAYGVTGVMAAVALDLGFDAEVSTALVSVQSAALLVGYAAFGYGVNHSTPRFLTLLGCLPFLLIPLMLIPNPIVFLTVFALIMLGRTIVDNAVPAVLRNAVPVEIAGPYNAWRMLLHYVGTTVSTAVAAVVSTKTLLFLALIVQLLAGLSYFTTKEIGGRFFVKK